MFDLFDIGKSTQMAAFFVQKEKQVFGKDIELLKIMKLLYIADKESCRQNDYPISGDRLVSMPHGPVPSKIYDITKGKGASSALMYWNTWIKDNDKKFAIVDEKKDFEIDDLLELSEEDTDILSQVWDQYGHLSGWALRELTHNREKFPEYTETKSSVEITVEKLFKSLGRTEEQIQNIEMQLIDSSRIKSI